MTNLNVVVSVDEGKKKESKKLTSFVIGSSIVKEELSSLNKEARSAKIREYALRFLTPEQQKLEFVCTASAEQNESKKSDHAENTPNITESSSEEEVEKDSE